MKRTKEKKGTPLLCSQMYRMLNICSTQRVICDNCKCIFVNSLTAQTALDDNYRKRDTHINAMKQVARVVLVTTGFD